LAGRSRSCRTIGALAPCARARVGRGRLHSGDRTGFGPLYPCAYGSRAPAHHRRLRQNQPKIPARDAGASTVRDVSGPPRSTPYIEDSDISWVGATGFNSSKVAFFRRACHDVGIWSCRRGAVARAGSGAIASAADVDRARLKVYLPICVQGTPPRAISSSSPDDLDNHDASLALAEKNRLDSIILIPRQIDFPLPLSCSGIGVQHSASAKPRFHRRLSLARS